MYVGARIRNADSGKTDVKSITRIDYREYIDVGVHAYTLQYARMPAAYSRRTSAYSPPPPKGERRKIQKKNIWHPYDYIYSYSESRAFRRHSSRWCRHIEVKSTLESGVSGGGRERNSRENAEQSGVAGVGSRERTGAGVGRSKDGPPFRSC
jgi:hypothetical protein